MDALYIFALPAALLAVLLLRNYLKNAAQRLSTCGDTCYPGGTLDPAAWFLGPELRGFAGGDFFSFKPQNKSIGMLPHPGPHSDGFVIDLPQSWAQGHLHYATFCHGPLTGKTRIRMRGRIEADSGVEFVNDTGPGGWLTLYFQRKGDDWSTDGKFETSRWWAAFAALKLEHGAFEIIAPLDGNWTATQTSSRDSNPEGFATALREASCVGFTTGGGSGWGHGMAATGPARLIVDEFVVE